MTTFAFREEMRRIAALGLSFVVSGSIGACTTAAGDGAPLSFTPVATSGMTQQPTAKPRSTPHPTPVGLLGSVGAGGAGWSLAVAGGSLWVQVDPPIDAIVRIDIETGSSEPAVPLGHKVESRQRRALGRWKSVAGPN